MAKTRFKNLEMLGKDRLIQIDMRLLKGEKPYSVARWMQKEWGVFADVNPMTLGKQLHRYHQEVVKKAAVANAKVLESSNGRIQLYKVTETINVVEEFEELLEFQKTRCAKLMETEQGMSFTLSTLTKELQVLQSMYNDLLRMQQEVGLKPKMPERHLMLISGGNKGNTYEGDVSEMNGQDLHLRGIRVVQQIKEATRKALLMLETPADVS